MSSPSPVRYRGNDYPVPTACGHREVPVRGYVHEVAVSGGAEGIDHARYLLRAAGPEPIDRERRMVERLTHHVQIPEMNGESFRLKQGRRGTTRRQDRTPASQPRLQSLSRLVVDFCSGVDTYAS